MIAYLSTNVSSQLYDIVISLQEALTIARYAKQISKHERAIAKGAATFFRKQGIAFGNALADHWHISEATARQLSFLASLFDDHVDTPIDYITNQLKDSYVAGMVFGNKEYKLGISFDVKNPRAVDYVDQRGLSLLKELNSTTKEDIRKIISDGLDNGDSYQTIARAIKSQFVDYSSKRAHKVAVTEAGQAYQAGNFGAIQEASETSLQFEKSWLPVSDPCPICADNADQGWLDLNDSFSSGHAHPVAHPLCRCAALYRRTSKILKPKIEGTVNDDIKDMMTNVYSTLAMKYPFLEDSFNGFDATSTRLAFEYNSFDKTIQMNKGYAKGSLDAANAWQNDESKGVGALVGGLDYTLVHEMGHAVDDYIKRGLNDDDYADYKKDKETLRDKIGNVSKYAEKNLNEWTAEQFLAEERNIVKDKPLQKLIDKYAAKIA